MERLRLFHFVCPDCIFKSTNEEALRIHLQQNHHDPISCPHSSCRFRFHTVSECSNHILTCHKNDGCELLYRKFLKTCNRPHARIFKYNAYQYNPTREYYIEFSSENYLRNFFGY